MTPREQNLIDIARQTGYSGQSGELAQAIEARTGVSSTTSGAAPAPAPFNPNAYVVTTASGGQVLRTPSGDVPVGQYPIVGTGGTQEMRSTSYVPPVTGNAIVLNPGDIGDPAANRIIDTLVKNNPNITPTELSAYTRSNEYVMDVPADYAAWYMGKRTTSVSQPTSTGIFGSLFTSSTPSQPTTTPFQPTPSLTAQGLTTQSQATSGFTQRALSSQSQAALLPQTGGASDMAGIGKPMYATTASLQPKAGALSGMLDLVGPVRMTDTSKKAEDYGLYMTLPEGQGVIPKDAATGRMVPTYDAGGKITGYTRIVEYSSGAAQTQVPMYDFSTGGTVMANAPASTMVMIEHYSVNKDLISRDVSTREEAGITKVPEGIQTSYLTTSSKQTADTLGRISPTSGVITNAKGEDITALFQKQYPTGLSLTETSYATKAWLPSEYTLTQISKPGGQRLAESPIGSTALNILGLMPIAGQPTKGIVASGLDIPYVAGDIIAGKYRQTGSVADQIGNKTVVYQTPTSYYVADIPTSVLVQKGVLTPAQGRERELTASVSKDWESQLPIIGSDIAKLKIGSTLLTQGGYTPWFVPANYSSNRPSSADTIRGAELVIAAPVSAFAKGYGIGTAVALPFAAISLVATGTSITALYLNKDILSASLATTVGTGTEVVGSILGRRPFSPEMAVSNIGPMGISQQAFTTTTEAIPGISILKGHETISSVLPWTASGGVYGGIAGAASPEGRVYTGVAGGAIIGTVAGLLFGGLTESVSTNLAERGSEISKTGSELQTTSLTRELPSGQAESLGNVYGSVNVKAGEEIWVSGKYEAFQYPTEGMPQGAVGMTQQGQIYDTGYIIGGKYVPGQTMPFLAKTQVPLGEVEGGAIPYRASIGTPYGDLIAKGTVTETVPKSMELTVQPGGMIVGKSTFGEHIIGIERIDTAIPISVEAELPTTFKTPEGASIFGTTYSQKAYQADLTGVVTKGGAYSHYQLISADILGLPAEDILRSSNVPITAVTDVGQIKMPGTMFTTGEFNYNMDKMMAAYERSTGQPAVTLMEAGKPVGSISGGVSSEQILAGGGKESFTTSATKYAGAAGGREGLSAGIGYVPESLSEGGGRMMPVFEQAPTMSLKGTVATEVVVGPSSTQLFMYAPSAQAQAPVSAAVSSASMYVPAQSLSALQWSGSAARGVVSAGLSKSYQAAIAPISESMFTPSSISKFASAEGGRYPSPSTSVFQFVPASTYTSVAVTAAPVIQTPWTPIVTQGTVIQPIEIPGITETQVTKVTQAEKTIDITVTAPPPPPPSIGPPVPDIGPVVAPLLLGGVFAALAGGKGTPFTATSRMTRMPASVIDLLSVEFGAGNVLGTTRGSTAPTFDLSYSVSRARSAAKATGKKNPVGRPKGSTKKTPGNAKQISMGGKGVPGMRIPGTKK